MPIASTLQYLQGLLDGLPMPETCPPMAAYVDPPDPNTETDIPTAYVWPTNFGEDRDPKKGGRSMPRNTGPGTFSGVKIIEHSVDIYIVWMGANDDPLFPGIVDAAMKALRFAAPMPTQVTDPYDGTVSQINDVGETMTGKIVVSALADQAYNRYDSLIVVPVAEEISA
jgi:hypothetical protein